MLKRKFGAVSLVLALAAGFTAGAPVYSAQAKPKTPVDTGVAVDKLADKKPGKLAKGEKFLAPPIKRTNTARMLTTEYRHYNVGQQFNNSLPSGVPQGVSLNMTIHSRNVDVADGAFHSISQIAWREITGPNPATDEQIVEFGYESNPGLFGDNLPRLLGSMWVDSTWCGSHVGSGSCGSAWVDDAGNSIDLGDSINGAVGLSRTFTIQYDSTIAGGGGFRLYYNLNHVGYFQKTGSGWPVNFDQLRTFQVFGEMGTTQEPLTTDCTGLGDGVNLGDDSPAQGAQVGSVTYKNGSGTVLDVNDVNVAVNQFSDIGTYPGTTAFDIKSQSTRTFRYGGPGVC
jgi:hypothetical protein